MTFGFGLSRMTDDQVREVRYEFSNDLRGKRDLRDEYDDRPTLADGPFSKLNVNLSLATASHTMEKGRT